MSRRHALLGSLVLSGLLACGQARQVKSEGAQALSCTRCHGGQLVASDTTDPLIAAAPPRTVSGASTGPAVGAHELHLAGHVADGHAFAAVPCRTCHQLPTSVSHPPQAQGRVTFSGLALQASGGSTPSPTWNGTSCSATYCHGAFPSGNAANAPVWGQARASSCGTCHGDPATGDPRPAANHPALAAGASCGACHPESVGQDGKLTAGGRHLDGAVQTDAAAVHPAGWNTPGSAAFHGPVAAQNGRACQRCHAAQPPATVVLTTCADCHAAQGASLCSGCHGSTANAAPPRDLGGNTGISALGVGAHQAHLTAPQGLSAPLDCTFCHALPADLFSTGHLDGQVTVSGYTGADPVWRTALVDPGWSAPSAAAATCATAYCHGAFPGGSAAAPLWTQAGQVACGSCHGLPPPAPHPAVQATRLACYLCHPDTVADTGDLVPVASGGKHLDGQVQVFDRHAASWMDTASSNFHALSANRGLADCTACHGADLSGGYSGISCGSCHDTGLPAGVPSWRVNCTMCHGSTANGTGAPPRSTWGTGNEPLRVGAHTKHVTGGAIAAAIPCSACHVRPADAFSAGHIDPGPAEITWSPLVRSSNASPAWDRATATCSSTYCHGGYSGVYTVFFFDADYQHPYAGTNASPSWTSGTPMTCTSCHLNPPPTGAYHAGHGGGTSCNLCHPHVNATGTAITNTALHVNGIIEVTAAWDPSCFNCH
ncbi:MAG: CxxxxCH/CxxCH domain-containing protein [Deltaproteobacteria bacterium]|nr:CxxxxCH/CxxCH domain-containing protein [Deltaproteobacteria bacterium]